ncbi:Ribosomal RNA small subunit methyltransferase J [Candidatus Erwinia haradaeae]|uniref:Ribosomal RNA small subunit methyltransferase J n=1 Tax=Candidatus Erwinia haradaeae TaxID=1922217 RepID=A0A451D9Q4_9GAMM|nr:Ribosomal RNA small subunit methyltransferase J [Candidatus Erwinia haradaeae]
MRICLLDESSDSGRYHSFVLKKRWKFQHDPNALMALVIKPSHLELRKRDEPLLGSVKVNFSSKKASYRRKFGGGRHEAVAKAVGVTSNYFPDVLDATAGLANDAFVLASCGCRVRMLERHPVVAALLEDGLRRGYSDHDIGFWLRIRLTLLDVPSLFILSNIFPKPDVIYLDPMYPNKKKSALVKKEMRMLQFLVGIDQDAAQLLQFARTLAKKRVVVKRPRYAQVLAGIDTKDVIKTKNHRFDIYTPLSV